MAKVTSKLQVTLPKALAIQYRIRAGDEILWVAAGDAIRVVPARVDPPSKDRIGAKLRLFDAATARQRAREVTGKRKPKSPRDRGWRREDLYDRDRSR
jgi:bifunctional DNA-binding transcriptional regulator/antitoxin component of YhaV-PrlF toxin-antitoxin module